MLPIDLRDLALQLVDNTEPLKHDKIMPKDDVCGLGAMKQFVNEDLCTRC